MVWYGWQMLKFFHLRGIFLRMSRIEQSLPIKCTQSDIWIPSMLPQAHSSNNSFKARFELQYLDFKMFHFFNFNITQWQCSKIIKKLFKLGKLHVTENDCLKDFKKNFNYNLRSDWVNIFLYFLSFFLFISIPPK